MTKPVLIFYMGFLNNSELKEVKEKRINKIKIRKVEMNTEEIEEDKIVDYTVKDESELVSMCKKGLLAGYEDFTKEEYPYSLNFYDFEVFNYDWMVVIMNPVQKTKTLIVNNREALKRYYSKHKNEVWIGYNSRNYDTYILKSILLGLNPKKTNDLIIMKGMKGWQIDDSFKDIQFYDFDIATKIQGLKQLEAFMGDDIRETDVPFDLPRKLTYEEIRQTVKYCTHDVKETIEVFRRRKSEYDAQVDLIKTFDLNFNNISSTQARLTANIIGCHKKKHDDEFDLIFVDTLRIKKYEYVLDWFKNPSNMNYKSSLSMDVCGVPHQFGWGGIHGCPDKPVHAKGKIFHVDVTSYYPSLMIEYELLTRNCKDPNKFKEIYDKRVELKRAGKKKEQAPYKIILNSTYGICKDKDSKAYDPLQANNVCVNGQLMLLDLLEHLEGHAEIIQSNTDGIILQVEDSEQAVKKMKSICQEWMDRTGMGLGFDEIDEIWQKDVNNYVFKFSNGKLERKGAYVKELNELDYDLPIVNKAIVNYLVKGITPYDTIHECNRLIEFQKVVKVSSLYKYGWHNGKFRSDKTYRVLASKDFNDSYIGKCKSKKSTVEKFANTPEHCIIWNENIKDVSTDELKKLDKKWYINLAEKRLKDFGFDLNDQVKLF